MRNYITAFKVIPYYFKGRYWKESIRKIFMTFLAIFGTLWLFVETANHFNLDIKFLETNPLSFVKMMLVAFVSSVIFNVPKLNHKVTIADTDISILLTVGNLLKWNDSKVIATNSTFDTRLQGNFISVNSLQGQFYKKHYTNIDHLDKDLENALQGVPTKEILNRTISKNNRYNIGTVAKISHENFNSYWLALADVNEHGKPNSNFENLLTGFSEIWEFIATKGHLENLVIPILGSGKTAVNQTRENILKELIFSFVAFASEKKITELLTIVIHPSDLIKHDLDFKEMSEFLDYTCKYKPSKNFGNSTQL